MDGRSPQIMRVIVFDMEIAQSVKVKSDWDLARKGQLGVSCVCLYDSETQRPHVYDKHTIEACMEHLATADLLVSYNGKAFDVPALEGYSSLQLPPIPHYDILDEIWKSAGKKIKGYRLTEVGERTVGRGKSGSGEHAPVLHAQGRWAELVDYCLGDVYLTKDVFNYIIDNGCVIGPDEEEFFVDRPIEPEDII